MLCVIVFNGYLFSCHSLCMCKHLRVFAPPALPGRTYLMHAAGGRLSNLGAIIVPTLFVLSS